MKSISHLCLTAFTLCILTLLPLKAEADWPTEKKKIEFLINKVENSSLKFERNGTIYPAKKAASHLRMKYRNALNSWFTPSKDKWTALLFIEKVASKSSLSGKLYYIHQENKKMPAGEWLKSQLQQYKTKN